MITLIAAFLACTSSRSPEPPTASESPVSTPASSPPEAGGLPQGGGTGERLIRALTLTRGPLRLPGVCEASGGAWVQGPAGPELWVVDDEQAGVILGFGPDGAPTRTRALRSVDGAAFEMDDLEGVAPAGAGAWLMGSHSLSNSGKLKTRGRIAHVGPLGEVLAWTPALRPEPALPEALKSAALAACPECGLPPEAETGVAKKGGLDLEGVALDGEGRLLLGLRGPRVGPGRALVLSVGDPGGAFTLGPSWALDLGGRGVRDLAWDAAHGLALVLAGPSGEDGPPPAIYTWRPGEEAKHLADLEPLAGESPEALALGPGAGELWVLWDAGDRIERELGKFECAKLAGTGFGAWAEARVYQITLD